MSLKQILKKIIKKIIYKEKADSETYVAYLRKRGARVGERTTFFAPRSTYIDTTKPYLISIGNDVQITYGVTILTYGYDWSVLKRVYGDVCGSAGAVVIEDNVFIGMHTTILKGVHIGKNVIIGANSLVNKDIPDNCVAAGNPVEIIMPLEQYYEKRKKAQLSEARDLVKNYRERYQQEPDDKALDEFFWLFSDGDSELADEWKAKMNLVGNAAFSYEKLSENHPAYSDKEDFLKNI